MSKLFNTLEKIRHHETRSKPLRRPSSRNKKGPPKSGSKGILIGMFALFGVLLIYTVALYKQLNFMTFYGTIQHVAQRFNIPLPDAATHPAKQQIKIPLAIDTEPKPAPAASAPKEPTDQEKMAQLNNRGTELVQQDDHWRALYYFDQAHRLRPQSPEPLINMGVALSELGLNGPAGRFFQQAHDLAPQHPALTKSLQTLASFGLLEEDLKAALAPHKETLKSRPVSKENNTQAEK